VTLAPVLAALEAGLREGIAPGLSAAVLVRGAEAHASRHGLAQAVPSRRELGERDLFDIASLTKVVATTSIAARMVDRGELGPDDPAARWLPALASGEKREITVRHLLAHASGLPAWLPLHASARGREAVLAATLAAPLEARPGSRAVYSDLGFIALGALLESAAGAPLHAIFAAEVAGQLGLAETCFPSAGGDASAGERSFVAARRTAERGPICGEVDDDNAWAMGGVAGHAGLFSTARDVARLGQAWLDALAGRSAWLGPATAAAFARRDPTPGSGRALGWDTPSREGSALGARLGRGPRGALGHLGFTGTSLWIDLDREVSCALLTNHVHPDGPDKERIQRFRARFHDAVAEALGI